jgi:hypothetical protein
MLTIDEGRGEVVLQAGDGTPRTLGLATPAAFAAVSAA